MRFGKREHLDDSVNMPLLVGSILFANLANLVGELLLKLIVSSE